MSCQSIDNVSKKINSSFNYSNVSCQIKWGYLSSLLPITFIDIFVLCTSTKTFRWNLKTLIDDFGFFMVMVLDLITHTWICFESGKRLFHFFSLSIKLFFSDFFYLLLFLEWQLAVKLLKLSWYFQKSNEYLKEGLNCWRIFSWRI